VAALLYSDVIGGLVSSTALTLLVLSVLYSLVMEWRDSNPPTGNKM
jgi:Cu/Ag efflux pump CusA